MQVTRLFNALLACQVNGSVLAGINVTLAIDVWCITKLLVTEITAFVS